jgi:plastocyanin
MRVPPQRGLPLAWLLRGILLLGIVSLALVALVAARPQPAPAVAAAPTVAPTTPPLPTLAPRPTQTPRPITSIIIRQTQETYPTSTPFPSGLATVSIVDFSFMPGTMRIRSGQSVLWRNDGTEQHDITGSDWHSGPLDPGYTYRLTFGIAGAYAYRCSIHLDMTGSVVVT